MKVWKKVKTVKVRVSEFWKKARKPIRNKPAEVVVTRSDVVRDRKKKAIGEVDYKDHVKMLCEQVAIKRGRKALSLVPVWVKISTGNREQGQGIVDQELPEGFECYGDKLKLGDVVRFKLNSKKDQVFFTSKVRVKNQLPTLRRDILQDLQASMTFNPTVKKEPEVVNKKELEVVTVEQAAMKLAVTNMALTQWLENRPEFTFIGLRPNKIWRPKDGAEIKAGYYAVLNMMETNEQEQALESERAKFEKDMASSRKEYMYWVNEFRVTYNLDLK